MIDPLISLALGMQSNKGVYALLLGSGVSRAAQIPTGWEVMLDLARKLALLYGEEVGVDSASWYREKYCAEPDYAKLLDGLAKTPEERQQLLRSYFEPNEEERDQGAKVPTAAHKAIADLVARGFVRVIVTTNFDRLLERAIEEAGVTPTVISTPDSADGCLPLVHQRCCIIKVHGDYLDTRIKNTPDELNEYDGRVNALLDRVFDEFGVVVCGWSAEWDPALRQAMERCKNRRFSLYWAARDTPGDHARRLLEAKQGSVIAVKDAERFFSELAEKVVALDDLHRPHPLSVSAAAATVKRLLSDDRHRIRLHDLVRDETELTFQRLQTEFADLLKTQRQEGRLVRGMEIMWNSIELLRAMCISGAYWAQHSHHRTFSDPIQRLATDPGEGQGGVHLNETVRAIPSVMVLYACGIAALAHDNLGMLFALLTQPQIMRRGAREPLVQSLDWQNVQEMFRGRKENREYFPASEWLFLKCREPLRSLIPGDGDYERLFDQFEMLRSLASLDMKVKSQYGETADHLWAPGGRFVWKYARYHDDDDVSMFEALKQLPGLAQAAASASLLHGDASRFPLAIERFGECVAKMSGRCH